LFYSPATPHIWPTIAYGKYCRQPARRPEIIQSHAHSRPDAFGDEFYDEEQSALVHETMKKRYPQMPEERLEQFDAMMEEA